MCDIDGELFIKPCTQSEIDFYHSLEEEHPRMCDIVPLFLGILRLNEATDINSINEQLPVVADHISTEIKEQMLEMMGGQCNEPVAAGQPATNPADNVKWIPNANRRIPTNTAVVLENAAYGYKRPNIMDVKLGIRLWADDAPLEKRRRFDRISAETTHRELGFRIAGMRVYKGSDKEDELDQEQYRIYDKDYGRHDVKNDNVIDAFRGFIYNLRANIDHDYARAVAEAFRKELERVRDVLESEETRMFSSSLLFIFEGDGDALKAAIDQRNGSVVRSTKEKPVAQLPGRTTSRIDSGIGLDDEGEIILNTAEPDDSDEYSSEEELKFEPKILTLKLIDFAHAKWTPGEGSDENILVGVRSLIKIFEKLSGE